MATACESKPDVDVQCHFEWKPEKNDIEGDPKKTLDHLLENMKHSQDIELLSWPLAAYLNCKLNPPNYPSALEAIDTSLKKCEELSDTNKGAAQGYKLVSICNKKHILQMMGRDEDAENLNEKPISFDDLTDIGKAAVHGVRAFALSLFGENNYAKSTEFYSMARKLDNTNYKWVFGMALVSGRFRRIREGVRIQPTEMEEENFRKACELTDWKKAIPIVLLADTLFQQGREMPTEGNVKNEALLKEAKEYYLKAYELEPNLSNVLKRCGKGFALMNEEDLAETCLKQAVALDKYSSQSLHRLGQLYEFGKTKKNLSLAEKNYTLAVTSGRRRNFYAECDLSRIRKKRDVTYDLVGHYQNMKIHYANDEPRTKIIEEKIDSVLAYNASRRAGKNPNRGNFRGKPRRF